MVLHTVCVPRRKVCAGGSAYDKGVHLHMTFRRRADLLCRLDAVGDRQHASMSFCRVHSWGLLDQVDKI